MRRLFKFFTYSIVGLVVVSATALIYLRNCEWNPELAAEYATQNAFIVHSDYTKEGCEYAIFRRVANSEN